MSYVVKYKIHESVYQFEGPIRVLYTMMVDPNASLKKAGSKDLPVVRGEILDVIQETSKKQLLCRNKQGKCESRTTCWTTYASEALAFLIKICYSYYRY